MTRSAGVSPAVLLALCGLALVSTAGAAQQTGPRAGPWQVATEPVEGGRRWYPETGGSRPLVLMITTPDRPPADTLLARYLASQGYDVLRLAGTPQQLAGRLSHRDATAMAVLAFGSGTGTARIVAGREALVRSLIQIDPSPETAPPRPGIAVLSFERDGVPSDRRLTPSENRLAVLAPDGRLHPGVIHAFLDYTLRGLGDPPVALAARLRRAGLEARAAAAGP